MTVLLSRIRDLERLLDHWRRRSYEMERSRDMWRNRARQFSRRGL